MVQSRRFLFKRATKRTYLFEEVDDNCGALEMCGVVYVQKQIFDSQPNAITVTIEVSNA